jgi:hypothetical protein
MDYFNLTSSRIKYVLFNPQMREAIFQIWLNRDYTKYAEQIGQDLSLQNWSPSEKLRLYIRKDVVSKLWDYGSTASAIPVQADPYEGKQITIEADKMIGFTGTEPGQFQNPRDVALAPDGTLYISDTSNNRIQHVSADGSVLQVWGSFAIYPPAQLRRCFLRALGHCCQAMARCTWLIRGTTVKIYS